MPVGSPASAHLEPGDVLTGIGGEPASAPESALLRLSTLLGDGPVVVTLVRGDEQRTATLQPQSPRMEPRAPSLRTVRGGVAVDSPGTDTALARAGVTDGDVIVSAGAIGGPSAQDISRLLETGRRGALTLVVRRGDRRVLVVVPPGSAAGDAP
jgi:S1-C subfamily serine protease